MQGHLSRAEIGKDAVQHTVAGRRAPSVGRSTAIIAGAVRDVARRSAGSRPRSSRSATPPAGVRRPGLRPRPARARSCRRAAPVDLVRDAGLIPPSDLHGRHVDRDSTRASPASPAPSTPPRGDRRTTRGRRHPHAALRSRSPTRSRRHRPARVGRARCTCATAATRARSCRRGAARRASRLTRCPVAPSGVSRSDIRKSASRNDAERPRDRAASRAGRRRAKSQWPRQGSACAEPRTVAVPPASRRASSGGCRTPPRNGRRTPAREHVGEPRRGDGPAREPSPTTRCATAGRCGRVRGRSRTGPWGSPTARVRRPSRRGSPPRCR